MARPAPQVAALDCQLNWEALSKRLLLGNGSPEGAVTAVAPAMYLRLNGGAGTTLYVKETGSGNTGWAAK